MKIFGVSATAASLIPSFLTICTLSFVQIGHAVDFDDMERMSNQGESRSTRQLDVRGISSDGEPYISDLPLDESEYKIGPGDLFQFFIESSSFERQVNPEGNIVLNRIGTVSLNGLSLKEAKMLLLDRLQSAYKRTNCFVNLSRPKEIRVFVTGAINAPGVYNLPGNYRLIDALNKASGFSIESQRGAVQILSGKDTIQNVNVRNFLVSGDLNSNPYLCQGCVIQVPFIDLKKPWVTVLHDSVSLFIQMESGDAVSELIAKSFSYHPPSLYTTILVTEKDGRKKLLTIDEAHQYFPGTGATLEMVYAKYEVFIGGAVQTPGFQPYRSDHKVLEYVSRAGLLTNSKLGKSVEVVHKDGKRSSLPLQSPDLRPGDVVLIHHNTEQKFLIYTPILLSVVSLALVVVQLSAN
jgi:protein involved in polysaccharide export with SLBB domain